MTISTYSNYRKNMIRRFWEYQEKCFPDRERYFEKPYKIDDRPPVFHRNCADYNVICKPDSPCRKGELLLGTIPPRERHRWFRSMASSQAVGQSILGNLKIHDRLDCLCALSDDDGLSLMGDAVLSEDNFHLEYTVDYLNEPRPTNVDGFVTGEYRVAMECKLMERDIGTCSRPKLTRKDKNYERDHCDGTYKKQRGRESRCSLTNIGVLYWEYIPDLFTWDNDIDHDPCPLRTNYQLVRNILAACVRPDGPVSPEKGHVVLIYDARNPAFQEGGAGYRAFANTKEALRDPTRLRKCSWQRIVNHLRSTKEFSWLVEQLALKYGL